MCTRRGNRSKDPDSGEGERSHRRRRSRRRQHSRGYRDTNRSITRDGKSIMEIDLLTEPSVAHFTNLPATPVLAALADVPAFLEMLGNVEDFNEKKHQLIYDPESDKPF
jgi:hypothetical protein